MRSFKKVLLPVAAIFLIFISISALILEPYLQSEWDFYQDSHLRDSLAGQIDLISVGASNGMCALVPQVLDDTMDCFSYNLSGSMMPLKTSHFLLEQELNRNPIKTVILDLSYDTLCRDPADEMGEGEIYAFARINSFAKRMQYLVQCVPFGDWLHVYSRNILHHALSYLSACLQNPSGNLSHVDYEARGFRGKDAADITLTEGQAIYEQGYIPMNTNYRDENLRELSSIIRMCKDRGIRVILTTYIRSDHAIWHVDGQDDFLDLAQNFAQEQGCEFYDTNLLKCRYDLFSDRDSYLDPQHLSKEGAAIFTEEFGRILKEAQTGDVSHYFYSSYEEMKKDSPYQQYIH